MMWFKVIAFLSMLAHTNKGLVKGCNSQSESQSESQIQSQSKTTLRKYPIHIRNRAVIFLNFNLS
jgi:hypothetical protein